MEQERQRAATLTLVVHGSEHEPVLRPSVVEHDELVVGRGEDCNIVLRDLSVSRRHASLLTIDGEHVIVDHGSANGTFVGDVKLEPGAPRALKDATYLRLGNVWLQVRMAPVETLPTDYTASGLVLRVKEGPDAGHALRLEADRSYVIGRGLGCDLCLSDGGVSRKHLTLRWTGSDVVVRALASKNAASVDGRELCAETDAAWEVGRAVRLGHATVLQLETGDGGAP